MQAARAHLARLDVRDDHLLQVPVGALAGVVVPDQDLHQRAQVARLDLRARVTGMRDG